MAMKLRKHPHCVVTNFGDGAASQGIVAESFNFAAVYKAPIVFVLENNGWAISTPVTSQAGVDVFALHGIGYGIPSVRVDGNDVLGMIAACRRACDHARSGRGPYLIEAVTYRMSLHTTADDPKAYRRDGEVVEWEARCPIRRMELFLQGRSLLDPRAIEHVHSECQEEVMAARAKFIECAKADPKEIFDFMYETLPPELEAQKAEYLAKLKRMGIE
jgi:TPP-dependent pyruvate/acetoin dehydrogenase alpha subunit